MTDRESCRPEVTCRYESKASSDLGLAIKEKEDRRDYPPESLVQSWTLVAGNGQVLAMPGATVIFLAVLLRAQTICRFDDLRIHHAVPTSTQMPQVCSSDMRGF